MKYVKQNYGSYIAFDEKSPLYKSLVKLPDDRAPVFLSDKDDEVLAYIEKQKNDLKPKGQPLLEQFAKELNLSTDQLKSIFKSAEKL